VGHDRAARRLADLARSGLRFVNRSTGCGTRLMTDALLDATHVDRAAIDGWGTRTEDTHVAVAAAVASGAGDVGPAWPSRRMSSASRSCRWSSRQPESP
jgi:putative molybdopterin biosynthesis protein